MGWRGTIGWPALAHLLPNSNARSHHPSGRAVDNHSHGVEATVDNPSDNVDEWLPSVEDPLLSVEDVTTISSVHPNRPTTTSCGFGLDWPDREA